ncbi:MAG TPA: SLBB domain-containing protein [Candidatus Eisenbacteria bacterium]|nr:SLBB domain-containing protein [Candidatus Eisenbacteria bacterium]
MRNRSFQPWPRLAAALRVGLFALGLSAVGAARSAAAPVPGMGDPGAAASLSAAAAAATAGTSAPGDAPAFAGRVDPDTYRVGPGDEFAFRSSDLLDPKILRVGPSGEILIPDAGALPVAGLTIRAMEANVREALRPFIRGNGFFLTLSRPRRFRAMVVGDVERPGAVLLQAPVRASDAIEAAGGVSPGGARRGIVSRRGADSLWVDLVRFERAGDLGANPLVFETDVVVVPTATRRVEIAGAVAHPEVYDLAPGDRASTLVAVAGGVLPRAALDAAALSRAPAPGIPEAPPFRLGAALAEPGGPDDPLLEEGDRLFVPEQAHWRESARVVVEGEVARPGPYSIQDGVDRVGALLDRAGGFTDWADRAAVRIERGTDAAIRDSAFLRLAREQDALLTESERAYVLAVSRERRALSLGVGAFLERGDARADVPLLDGDRIVVPRRAITVMVQGEVMLPGHVPFQEGKSAVDYVKAAGGFTSKADKRATRVTLAATGRAVGIYDTGILHAGDIVWVPARGPRSGWAVTKDILTIAVQAATIWLVVNEATK